ncbi:MAG: acyl--CoA ligase [Peptococcaceae bacterium]|nr:acyl--CoA ligase [Peptococcaceae bacterium]
MNIEKIFNQENSIYETWRLCNAEHGELTAIEYFGNTVTYKRMDEIIDLYARAFMAMLPDKTRSVTVCLAAMPVAAFVFYALNKIGVRVNYVSPAVMASDPKKYLDVNDTEILVLLDGFFSALSEGIKTTALKNMVVVSLADGIVTIPDYVPASIRARLKRADAIPKIKEALPQMRVLSLDEFLTIGRQSMETVPSLYTKGDSAVVLYTGGSTGIPKGVEKTNEEFLSLARVYNQNGDMDHECGDRFLVVVPPNHPTGLVHNVIMPGFYGATMIFQPFYDKNTFADDLCHTKATFAVGAPSHYATFPLSDLPDGALSHLRWAYCGGEPVSEQMANSVNAAMKRLGVQNPYLVVGYGMSEVGPVVFLTRGRPDLINKVGPPMRGALARIVDDHGHEVGNNVLGNIELKTNCTMKCYYKQPELTKAFFTDDGYAKTLDMGIRDDNGDYDILGRAEDWVAGPDGSKVYLFHIERVVYKDPAVLETEVVGLEINGRKEPVVHIVLQPDFKGRNEEVIVRVHKLCQEHLTKNQMPRGYKVRETFGTNAVSQKRDWKALLLEHDGYCLVEGETVREVNFRREAASSQVS